MTKYLTIAALLASTAAASAQGLAIETTWGHGYAHTRMYRVNPTPNIINVPAPATDEEYYASLKREANWLARCNPRLVKDPQGVDRYVYAAPGCEFGD